MKMDTIKLIERLSNAFGPSGFEDDVMTAASAYAKDFAILQESSIRNLYVRPKTTGRKKVGRPPKSDKPVLMIDAHSDEIGFMVHSIMPNGMIKIHPLGGWAPTTLPSSTVIVKNADGEPVRGIITSVLRHFKAEPERGKPLEISDMMLDIGAHSAEQAAKEYKIRIGAPIVPDVRFNYDSKTGVMMGKAFDDRLGCACVLETLRYISYEYDSLGVSLVGTLTSQEEVGLRGAIVAANEVKPDIAIFFEGTPADDYFEPPHMIQTALRKGPMLRHIDDRMITNPRFLRFALDIAQEKNISVQEAVRKGGATNAGAVHISGQGVPCIVIGVPVRYIHTHHSLAVTEDYTKAVELAVEIVRKLDFEIIAKF